MRLYINGGWGYFYGSKRKCIASLYYVQFRVHIKLLPVWVVMGRGRLNFRLRPSAFGSFSTAASVQSLGYVLGLIICAGLSV